MADEIPKTIYQCPKMEAKNRENENFDSTSEWKLPHCALFVGVSFLFSL